MCSHQPIPLILHPICMPKLSSSGMRKEDLSKTLINVPCLSENPKIINQTPVNGFHQNFTVINECSMLEFKNHNCWGCFQLGMKCVGDVQMSRVKFDFKCMASQHWQICECFWLKNTRNWNKSSGFAFFSKFLGYDPKKFLFFIFYKNIHANQIKNKLITAHVKRYHLKTSPDIHLQLFSRLCFLGFFLLLRKVFFLEWSEKKNDSLAVWSYH